MITKDNKNYKKAIILAWNEEAHSRIHSLVSKVTKSQGRAPTSNKTIVSLAHSGMELEDNFYGLHKKISDDGE